MSERVIITIENQVATVTLNRAEKRNAVDMDMFAALIDTAESLARNNSVRAVVLHGDGGHFCAGIDISVFEGGGSVAELTARMEPRAGSVANFYQSVATLWQELPVPVIAALEGTTFGAGFQIAMGADVRYAGQDLQISIMEIKWGIIPDMGITVTVPGVVPQDKARLLAYTGRVLTAVEAQEFGLVTELADNPVVAAHALATEISQKSPDAIRAIKRLTNEAWGQDSAALLRREAELQMAVMAGENMAEAVQAVSEARAPRFKDPG
ncbi:MAG: crotonase/enoyl-CoA hydratase family protein [Woeseiaceae bacterium]